MNERPVKPIRPGGQISASEVNRAMDRLDGLSDFSGSDISSTDEFGNVILKTTIPPRTNIRILSGANPYVWEEVYLDTDGIWNATGVRSGTLTETPAYERTGAPTVAAGTVADAAFDAGPSGGGRWLFNVGGPGASSEFDPCLDDTLPVASGSYKVVVQQTNKCLATIEAAECTSPMDLYGGTLP